MVLEGLVSRFKKRSISREKMLSDLRTLIDQEEGE